MSANIVSRQLVRFKDSILFKLKLKTHNYEKGK